MTYVLPGLRERVVLSDEVLQYLLEFRQLAGRDEAGGQLFAKFDGDSVISVVRATGPSSRDRRGQFWFIPSRWREQAEINRMYREGLHFVGDWHTHPQGTPEPSQKDIDSILDCHTKSRKGIRGFLLIIVGLNPFPTGLYVGLTNATHVRPLAFLEGERF